MTEPKQAFFRNKQVVIWLIILSATLLVVAALLIYLVQDTTEFRTVDVPIEESEKLLDLTKPEGETSDFFQISIMDFAQSYTGTRESIDGSIEPVLLELKNIDQDLLTCEFTLNIGVTKKYRGIAYIDLLTRQISSDAIGILKFSARKDGRISLVTADTTRTIKYNLIQESR